ncbi:MAG: transcriptional regulator [Chloroflexota bacterium]|nr:MAG: transcriptional regulator [Chloroflexota bacterium]
MIKIQLHPTDFAGFRFAYSPLMELVMSYRVWRDPQAHAYYTAWINQVEEALRGEAFPYLDTVITYHYTAQFMMPTPLGPMRSFEDELIRVQNTSEDVIRREMQRLLMIQPPTPAHHHFLDDPCGALARLLGEMALYWERALAPDWRDMVAVLENEILHQARQFALKGAEESLCQLGSNVTYADGLLLIDKELPPFLPSEYCLKGDGLQLVPGVFQRKGVPDIRPDERSMLRYPARGIGLMQADPPTPAEESLRLLVGEGKARVLMSLTLPRSTQELARHLNLSAGAISQHLRLMQQAGFVESHRSGYYVFYRLSTRGERLLEVFNE